MENIQVECKRCGTWHGSSWDEKGGCPACQGIVGYPYTFMETDEYRRERNEKRIKQRLESFAANIGTIKPKKITQEQLGSIIIDLCITEWRDEQAYEMVLLLVQHVLATDKTLKKTLTLT